MPRIVKNRSSEPSEPVKPLIVANEVSALATRISRKYGDVPGAVVALIVAHDGPVQCCIQVGGFEVAYQTAATIAEAMALAEAEACNT
jgi:hypothetical protein